MIRDASKHPSLYGLYLFKNKNKKKIVNQYRVSVYISVVGLYAATILYNNQIFYLPKFDIFNNTKLTITHLSNIHSKRTVLMG